MNFNPLATFALNARVESISVRELPYVITRHSLADDEQSGVIGASRALRWRCDRFDSAESL